MLRVHISFAMLLAFFSTSLVATQKAPSSDESQRAVIDLENRWLQSEDNPTALETILADDFVHVLPVGFVTKKQQIAYVRSHPRPAGESRHFEGLNVRVYGDAAVATGVVVATATSEVRRTLFTDVFVKRNGRWQAVNSQELPEQSRQ